MQSYDTFGLTVLYDNNDMDTEKFSEKKDNLERACRKILRESIIHNVDNFGHSIFIPKTQKALSCYIFNKMPILGIFNKDNNKIENLIEWNEFKKLSLNNINILEERVLNAMSLKEKGLPFLNNDIQKAWNEYFKEKIIEKNDFNIER